MLVDANGSSPIVTGAIRQASRMTGTNFKYLVATAQVESNFKPNAGTSTSTARGLFQFIEQTWLATLKEQGPALGYGRVANAIERMPSGQYVVQDRRLNDQIMNLRSDPTANAVMAGAFTKANAGKLSEALGRRPSEGELYLAHFLGPNGASKLIGLAASKPGARAAEAFPSAARANPSIFFDKHGQMRGAADVYRTLVGRYDMARGNQIDPTVPPAVVAQVATNPVGVARRAAFAPDTAQLTEAYAAARRLADPPAQLGDTGPVFHGLFHTGARRDAVAPVVSALWTAPSPQTSAFPKVPSQEAAAAAPVARSGGPLDLFQDQAPDTRALFRGRV